MRSLSTRILLAIFLLVTTLVVASYKFSKQPLFAPAKETGIKTLLTKDAEDELLKANLSKDFKRSDAKVGEFGGVMRRTHLGKDPKTFNPWISNDATSSAYAALMFEGLTVNDPDTYEVKPHMAKSFEIQDGGKKIIVAMRQNIFWSDGKQITADDVVYTWNTLIRDQVAVSSLRDILLVEGEFPKVKKIGYQLVSFETEKVFAPFLDYLGIAIAPKHDVEAYFKRLGAKSFEEKQKAFNNYLNINTKPIDIVSNGPFKLSKLHHGERIEFARNPKYFVINKEGRHLPYVDKLVYSYVIDQSADIFKFLAGESHTLGVTPANAAMIRNLEDKYDFKLYELGPSTGTNFIWFNMSQNVKEPKFSWFNNQSFRKAISYAIDRESIIENVFQGLGAPLFTAESLASPFLNKKLEKGHPRNLLRAFRLLSEAGFKYDKENKILYDVKGNRVEFDLFTNAGNKQRELMATIIVSNIKELGIKVNFKLLEFNNFVARIMAGKNYESGLLAFTGGTEPNSGANVWKSDGRLHSFDVRTGDDPSPVRDWEEEIDELFKSGVQTMDFKERKKIYDKFQEIVYEQMPFVYVASPETLAAAKNDLANIRKTKYAGIIPNIYEVYLLKK